MDAFRGLGRLATASERIWLVEFSESAKRIPSGNEFPSTDQAQEKDRW